MAHPVAVGLTTPVWAFGFLVLGAGCVADSPEGLEGASHPNDAWVASNTTPSTKSAVEGLVACVESSVAEGAVTTGTGITFCASATAIAAVVPGINLVAVPAGGTICFKITAFAGILSMVRPWFTARCVQVSAQAVGNILSAARAQVTAAKIGATRALADHLHQRLSDELERLRVCLGRSSGLDTAAQSALLRDQSFFQQRLDEMLNVMWQRHRGSSVSSVLHAFLVQVRVMATKLRTHSDELDPSCRPLRIQRFCDFLRLFQYLAGLMGQPRLTTTAADLSLQCNRISL